MNDSSGPRDSQYIVAGEGENKKHACYMWRLPINVTPARDAESNDAKREYVSPCLRMPNVK
jgi:hypothetical protein